MQDIRKDNFSEEENNYSHKENIYHEVKTAFGDLDKNRKIIVIFLVFFSFSFFIFWVVSTKKTINNQLNPAANTETEPQYELLEGKENIDTDGDGLYDWEENEIYKTSPYLADTDGDGISDGEEIEAGTDPLCPEGQDCGLNDVLFEQEQIDTEVDVEMNRFINENINLNIEGADGPVVDEDSFSEILEGGMEAKDLRAMLLGAGMDETILNTISDEDLMQSYQEILQ